ncbi:MAG: tetratricopeptide repeat protein [Woeseiaceae bacterium]|nr:tetratricopeptide repeat protein [Woeseiaceae bacterium]NIP20825.1 tetratricopeptide repeat protein [Woeseiaceae bacterium]NIS89618.1 tetratricopeptide repeat protein [Woeseiaceae bacterium]
MAGAYSFIRELRRRKVFKGAALYLVGAWLVLQVADVVAEPAGLPPWTMTALLYLAAIGFPVAVFLGWRYEIGEHGLVRTAPARAADDADLSLQRSDYVMIGVFLVVAGLAAWQLLPQVIEDAEQSVTIAGDFVVHRNSVAVLPFQDYSPNADHSYLSNGLADNVTHVLGQVEGLLVTARTSAQAFRETTLTAFEIARELRVAHFLEGSVQRQGEEVRVLARLVSSENGSELWSRTFDRPVADIFEIQDEIAVEVVNALNDVLQQDEAVLKEEYRPDLAAYEQVVLGKQELDTHTVDGAMRAWDHFSKAIEIDPDYAMAYVHKADVLNLRDDLSMEERNEQRRDLIDRALELDPLSADALVHLALFYRFDDELEKVGPTLERAIELNPSLVDARVAYSYRLFASGDNDGALEQARIAAELDPRNESVMMALANAYWSVARAEEAIAILKDLMRQDPSNPSAYQGLSRWYMQMGKPGQAMRYRQALLELDPQSQRRQAAVCDMHYQLWDQETAFACTEAYLERFPDDLDAKKNLLWFRDGPDAAEPLFREQIEAEPWFEYRKVQYANFLSWERRHAEVIDVVEAAYPQLAGNAPEIDDWTSWPARLLAQAYVETGEKDRGLALLAEIERAVQRMRKLQGTGWVAGHEDAQIYAIRGEKNRALDALEAAIDAGWMFYSYGLENDPSFDAYKDDPRFLTIVQKLRDRMAQERQWYQDHKDDALY